MCFEVCSLGRIPDWSLTTLASFRLLQYVISIGLGLTSPVLVATSSNADNGSINDSSAPVPEELLRSLSVIAPISELKGSDESQPSGLDNLSMNRAVELSVDRNPKLRSSYLTFRSSQDLLGASYGAWWPTLSFSVGSGIYNNNSNNSGAATNNSGSSDIFSGLFSEVFSELSEIEASLPPTNTTGAMASSGSASSFNPSLISSDSSSMSGQTEGNYFYTTLTLSLTWDVINAARPLNIWKSKYQMLQDADRYTITYRDNTLNVKNAYVDLQSSVSKKLAYKAILANSKRLLRISEDKLSLGVASGLDVAKQKTNYFSDLSLYQQSDRDIKVNQSKLALLLNVDNPMQIVLNQTLLPLGGWNHDLDQTISASEAHRKVVQEMLLDVYLQDTSAEIEMASYLPTLQLVAQLYGTQTGYITESYAEFVRNPSAVLTFTWKAFDGGQARMRSSSYQKLADSSYETYLDTINQVKETAQIGYFNVEKGRDIVLASANEVKESTLSLELQTDRYEIGYGTVTDLIQAQTAMAKAVLDYVGHLQDYNKSLLELARNTGLPIDEDQNFVNSVGNPLTELSYLDRR